MNSAICYLNFRLQNFSLHLYIPTSAFRLPNSGSADKPCQNIPTIFPPCKRLCPPQMPSGRNHCLWFGQPPANQLKELSLTVNISTPSVLFSSKMAVKCCAGYWRSVFSEQSCHSDIQEIRIHLEKHGEFYHPARIETDVIGSVRSLLCSTSPYPTRGKKHIYGEFHNLKRLNTEFAESFLPRVYSLGEVTSAGGIKFCMFLGEWFQDYHEFHISRQTSGNQRQVCVWDDRNGRYYLSREQTLRLYRQAARIMTGYYNVTTFEHISPWHHAAGDFIIRLNQNNIDLKLITVRGYAPLFKI